MLAQTSVCYFCRFLTFLQVKFKLHIHEIFLVGMERLVVGIWVRNQEPTAPDDFIQPKDRVTVLTGLLLYGLLFVHRPGTLCTLL